MLVSGVVLGVLSGAAVRRSWAPLSRISVRLLPVLVLALGLRVLATALPTLGLPAYELAMAATAAVAVANLRLPGAVLILVGGLLNLIVVLANGGMPVDPAALAAVGAGTPTDMLHVALTGSTRAQLFADVIPVALFRSVYSVGDVGIAVGGFLIPFSAFMRL